MVFEGIFIISVPAGYGQEVTCARRQGAFHQSIFLTAS